MRFLLPQHQKALAEFINSPLWAEVRLCLEDRKTEVPDVRDPSHIAAAKGHQRAGAEKIILAIENLHTQTDDSGASPMDRPAVAITED